MRGPHSFAFAYHPDAETPLEHAESYRHPFLTASGTAAEAELRSHAGPALEGGPGVVLTAYLPGRARIVNESPDAQAVRFAGRQVELRPWEIRTISV